MSTRSERRRRGDWKRRAARGDGGNDADDAGGGGGDDERGIACASRAQTRVSMCVSADGSTSRDTHAWAGVGGHTMARFVALAILEHPPSPPVRAGPIHVMGRAVHSRVHTLSGQPRVRHCPDCAVDGSRVPCACARTREQPNARENNSLSCDDHGDMRRGLGCARIEAWFTWLFESSWRSTCAAAAA